MFQQTPSESPNQPESIESKLATRVNFIVENYPQLDRSKVTKFLSTLTSDEITKLKIGAFASLIFDTVFSPGVIPKDKDLEYHETYAAFFRNFYGKEVFDEKGFFVYQDEADFYLDHQEGPNNPEFIREWVANIRAVTLMLSLERDEQLPFSVIKTNLAEAVICRLAELGEEADDLFNILPIHDQIRLEEVSKKIAKHSYLAPGAVFRIANEIEFSRQKFARATSDRPILIENAIQDIEESARFSALPPEPGEFSKNLQTNRVNWNDPEKHQMLFSNLHGILHNEVQLNGWTALIINSPNSRFPNLFQTNNSELSTNV